MKRYANTPNTVIPNQVSQKETAESISSNDISIAKLLDDGLVALYREIKNLLRLSAQGKLGPADAKDLRDHLKLLFELNDREKEALTKLTDKELSDKAKSILESN